VAAPKRFRVLRFGACVAIGLLLAVPIYVGIAKSGLIRSPFFPRLGGDTELAESNRPGLRVLFVGNSYTYYNSMPAMVRELAEGDPGSAPVYSVEYTAPSWSWKDAAQDDGLADALEDFEWDVVVLQDISWHLSLSPEDRRRMAYPYAVALDRLVREGGARTMLFMTWGYRDGALEGDSFDAMQARLAEGFTDLGSLLDAEVVPVGIAWAEALRRRPGLDLWKRDGGHPSKLGSYLAACVFYGVLTGRDPTGSDFAGGLTAGEALFLQDVAADVVSAYAAA
jgi:hypothetical protein